MALTKVTNDLQDALAAAQPTITSVGTLTGLTVSGTATADDVTTTGVLLLDSADQAFVKLDRGTVDHYNILRYYTAGTELWRAGMKTGSSNYSISNASDAQRLTIDSGGKVAIGSTVANKIFNLADPDQGGEALKLHFEANASADKWAMYAYDRTNGHYANMSFGANSLVIDNGGRVTMPSQPAFSVEPNGSQNNIASGATIGFQVENFDVGSNFASNTFTAPVTGKYQLNVLIRLEYIDSASSYYQFLIMTSNRTYQFTIDPTVFSSDPAYWSTGYSVLADMDAYDTAYIQLGIGTGGANQADLGTEAHFTGYLVA